MVIPSAKLLTCLRKTRKILADLGENPGNGCRCLFDEDVRKSPADIRFSKSSKKNSAWVQPSVLQMVIYYLQDMIIKWYSGFQPPALRTLIK